MRDGFYKNFYSFVIFIFVLTLYLFSYTNIAQAVDSACRERGLATLQIKPSSGDVNSLIELVGKFTWSVDPTFDHDHKCTEAKILTYIAYSDTDWEFNFDVLSLDYIQSSLKDLGSGKKEYEIRVNIRPIDLSAIKLTGLDKIYFQFGIIDGNDSTPFVRFLAVSKDYKTFTLGSVQSGASICAYKKDNKNNCISGTNNYIKAGQCNEGQPCAKCNEIPVCNENNGCFALNNTLCQNAGGPLYGCVSNGSCVANPSNPDELQKSGRLFNNEVACKEQCPGIVKGPGSPSNTVSGKFQLKNPLGEGFDNIEDLANAIAGWIFRLAIPVAIIMILYGGLLMLTAGVKADNFKQGRQVLTYAIVGLIVIFIGRGFVSLVQSILQLKQ